MVVAISLWIGAASLIPRTMLSRFIDLGAGILLD
jgi:hypothetical protein